MSEPSLAEVFSPRALGRLERAVEIVGPRPITEFRSPEARAALATARLMVTGWNPPRVDAAVVAAAPNLRAIVHAAGTVKTFLSDDVFRSGIRVSSCAAANAIPVAEFTFASIVFGLKRVGRFSARLRSTHAPRDVAGMPPIGASGVTIGLVGASRVGREVIRLLNGLDVRVLVSDPYLPASDAALLGIELTDLHDLCRRSDVLSLHAPLTPETRRIIGTPELALLRDGAVVINTARGPLIDTTALTAELVSGRLDAYLDVTDPEPLPEDSPLYDLPNVTLTPHIAGALGNEVLRLGDLAVDEIERLVFGAPLKHEIRYGDLARIA